MTIEHIEEVLSNLKSRMIEEGKDFENEYFAFIYDEIDGLLNDIMCSREEEQ